MQPQQKHGVVGVAALDADEHTVIETLLAACNQHEQVELPINLGSIDPDAAQSSTPDQFLAYDHGTLIGYARVDGWSEPELCGMVHPDHRRRGVGRSLLSAAQHECARHGLKHLTLVCDERSASGKAFVGGVGAQFYNAEYRMQLDPAAIDRSLPRHDTLRLQPATADDIAVLTMIQAAAFGDPEAEVRQHVIRGLGLSNRQYLIGLLDEQPIGMLRLGRYRDEADITAFGVLPAYQGRGYGRQMLVDALDILLAEPWPRIMIDVLTDNDNALKLYRNCGFREVSTYGYYRLGV
jgi:ribosomal protein S18 acetylase RimI-like enzyme